MLSGSPPFLGHGGKSWPMETLVPTLDIGLLGNPRALVALQGVPSRFLEAKAKDVDICMAPIMRFKQLGTKCKIRWCVRSIECMFETLCIVSNPLGFFLSKCMPINLEFPYYFWCHGHLSSISSTFVLISQSHVEANFIMKAWEQKYHHSKLIWEDPMVVKLSYRVGATSDNHGFFLNMDDTMDANPWLKYTQVYKIGKHAHVSFTRG